ncbi:ferritin [Desulfonispora thiosulfatigenes DSM 11270]|uniref:Ferritin n=1 Tax=Desulfonispora thiosulfatigenes DSM 11270 TaxID=656914 RepID=A0A1W1V3P4_DESTI|nr:ferritin [Desulfonispora thiosulfatigenes]SMB87915.1 ferritin [Desulfonispora thiosulfatigenes DSM 11270]
MISSKLLDALNEQVKFELDSGHLYVAMAAYLADEGLDGFSHFFIVQEQEERFHAMKFFRFINEMDGKVVIKGLENPDNEYESVLDVFEKALNHEKEVTKRIYNLMDLAIEEKEHTTINFLKWFIDEQLEEENTMKDIIKKLKFNQGDTRAIFMLDTEMAQRVFTPPVNEG